MRDRDRLSALAGYDILDTAPEQGDDDIVRLACDLCAAPVAVVSLVDDHRQWFKARIGFGPCETDLGQSVCAHALAHGVDDLLVIPDLTADPRTAANPLVTGAPHLRFYAGAPLPGAGGMVLGSLCRHSRARWCSCWSSGARRPIAAGRTRHSRASSASWCSARRAGAGCSSA